MMCKEKYEPPILTEIGALGQPYKLFIDDQLDDPDAPARWLPQDFVGAKSSEEAIAIVKQRGFPYYLDLDHDLADGDDVMIFLKWLWNTYPYTEPPEFNIHSANPVGKKNIESFINSWKKSLNL
jgi:hypothetical protein